MHKHIRLQHPPQLRIINPPVHVNDDERITVLMAGVAPQGFRGKLVQGGRPDIVAQFWRLQNLPKLRRSCLAAKVPLPVDAVGEL